MKPSLVFKIATLAALLVSCGFPVHQETLDGPYKLAAMDSMREMAVTVDGFVLVKPTVFAAGVDERYVVAARRAWSAGEEISDRGSTEFFYIVRRADETEHMPKVIGPLTRAESNAARAKLKLPQFSREFTPEELTD